MHGICVKSRAHRSYYPKEQQTAEPGISLESALAAARIQGRSLFIQEFMQQSDIIVKDQDILGGTPVFRGTRVPFQALSDYIEGGQTLAEFPDDFPTVSKDAPLRVVPEECVEEITSPRL